MGASQDDIEELRRQLGRGAIQKAYRALLEYMLDLRTYFTKQYPDYAVSGLYQGYLDMSYFALTPPALKPHSLKIAIVFNFEAFRFEAWLSGRNRLVLRQYWELFKEGRWPGWRVVDPPGKWADSILEHDLVEEVDFSDPDALTSDIGRKTLAFIAEIEKFLAGRQPSARRSRAKMRRNRSAERCPAVPSPWPGCLCHAC